MAGKDGEQLRPKAVLFAAGAAVRAKKNTEKRKISIGSRMKGILARKE